MSKFNVRDTVTFNTPGEAENGKQGTVIEVRKPTQGSFSYYVLLPSGAKQLYGESELSAALSEPQVWNEIFMATEENDRLRRAVLELDFMSTVDGTELPELREKLGARIKDNWQRIITAQEYLS